MNISPASRGALLIGGKPEISPMRPYSGRHNGRWNGGLAEVGAISVLSESQLNCYLQPVGRPAKAWRNRTNRAGPVFHCGPAE
jgi:hypothetical protein